MFLDPVGELCGPGGPVEGALDPRQPRYRGPKEKPCKDARDAVPLAMDRLLCLRDAAPQWYAVHGRRHWLTLLRALFARDEKGDFLAEAVAKRGRYGWLRRDAAAGFHDVQLFAERDIVNVPARSMSSYRWRMVTEKGADWEWDADAYNDWVQARRKERRWPETAKPK